MDFNCLTQNMAHQEVEICRQGIPLKIVRNIIQLIQTVLLLGRVEIWFIVILL